MSNMEFTNDGLKAELRKNMRTVLSSDHLPDVVLDVLVDQAFSTFQNFLILGALAQFDKDHKDNPNG